MILEILLIIYTIILILINLAQLYLFKILPSLKVNSKLDDEPLVSIIIPVKNEANKLKESLDSIINLDYKNKEIIVVYGESNDGTGDILKEYKDKLKIIQEPPLPDGWVGKNWACYIGYKYSNGEYLLFTDADTIHDKTLLRTAITKMKEEKLDFITLIPSLYMKSKFIKMLLPIIGQFIFVINLAPYFNKKSKYGIFGNGQYMLFKRDVYEKIGGHLAVKNKIIEDFNMAKILKKEGYETRLYNSLNLFSVRMYDSFGELLEGWGKNFYIGLKANILYMLLAILALIVIYLLPFMMLISDIYNIFTYQKMLYFPFSEILYIFYLFRFGVMYYKLNVNPIYSLIYFLPITFILFIIIYSYYRFKKGIIWKNRVYVGKEVI
jgi:chlorobactene glucosyltransferase